MTPALESHALEVLERSGALLRRLEWSGNGPDGEAECPDCREPQERWVPDPSAPGRNQPEPGVHAATCELAALIGARRASPLDLRATAP